MISFFLTRLSLYRFNLDRLSFLSSPYGKACLPIAIFFRHPYICLSLSRNLTALSYLSLLDPESFQGRVWRKVQ
uniref:Uncharacterized protein n=1 Tax=Picea sitchensis TaxID=3332 RepID=A0A6B9XSE5_PICSI|nr:hypothetical protein Q903MT_gene3950 [Picea sitchensis]